MIAVTPRPAGGATRRARSDARIAAAAPRSLGRREVRRQHVARGARRGRSSTATPGSPAPAWSPSRPTIVILVAVALLVPLPTAVQLRDWATSVGPWFPLAFFARPRRGDDLPVPAHRVHAGRGPAVRPAARRLDRRRRRAPSARVIALLLVRAAGLAAQPAGAASPGRRRSTPGCGSAAGRRCCRCG